MKKLVLSEGATVPFIGFKGLVNGVLYTRKTKVYPVVVGALGHDERVCRCGTVWPFPAMETPPSDGHRGRAHAHGPWLGGRGDLVTEQFLPTWDSWRHVVQDMHVFIPLGVCVSLGARWQQQQRP